MQGQYTLGVSVSTSDPMLGRVLAGRYQLRSRIGIGSSATVYLATDLRLERRVAVKVLHNDTADDDDQYRGRLAR